MLNGLAASQYPLILIPSTKIYFFSLYNDMGVLKTLLIVPWMALHVKKHEIIYSINNILQQIQDILEGTEFFN